MVLPYLNGFDYLLCLVFWWMVDYCSWYCVFILRFIFRSIQEHNKWYQSTFLGQRREDLFSLFADFFFGEKKRGPWLSRTFWYIYENNLQKMFVDMISSQKNTQFEKKNRPKRSPEDQDIEVLKSAIFRVFSADGGAIYFYFCSIWRPNLPK